MAGKYVHLDPKKPDAKLETVSCITCQGTLQIRAKGYTKVVACEYCGTIQNISLDKNQTQVFGRQKPIQNLYIPLGKRGKLHGMEWEVIGFMQRRSTLNSQFKKPFTWQEYLLFNPYKGFRWLTEHQGHWNYVCTLHNLPKNYPNTTISYMGERFKKHESYEATVEFVIGEFYWLVKIGDQCLIEDYLHETRILSVEKTHGTQEKKNVITEKEPTLHVGSTVPLYIDSPVPLSVKSREQTNDEQIWSLAEYIEPHEIATAFQLKRYLPAKINWAINQPTPGKELQTTLSKSTLFSLALFIGLLFFFSELHPTKPLMREVFYTPPSSFSGQAELATAYVSPSFQIEDHQVLKLSLQANVDNSWLSYDIDLINEQTGQSLTLEGSLEYYSGYDDEGSYWSTGSRTHTWELANPPKGSYHLWIRTPATPVPLQISIQQGGFISHNITLTFFLLIAPICFVVGYHLFCEWLKNED